MVCNLRANVHVITIKLIGEKQNQTFENRKTYIHIIYDNKYKMIMLCGSHRNIFHKTERSIKAYMCNILYSITHRKACVHKFSKSIENFTIFTRHQPYEFIKAI